MREKAFSRLLVQKKAKKRKSAGHDFRDRMDGLKCA
jgi:hypothetical protein